MSKKLRQIVSKTNNVIHASIHKHEHSIMESDGNDENYHVKGFYTQKYFTDADNTVDNTQKLHEKWSKHYPFNSESGGALHSYGGNSYGVNSHLWHSHKAGDGEKLIDTKPQRKQVSQLDAVLSEHKTPHDITVYSGINYDPSERKNKQGIVHHPAYLSTSFAPGIAREFGDTSRDHEDVEHRHTLAIHVPQGHAGAYASHRTGLSREREFILPRGMNLKHQFTEDLHLHDRDGRKYVNHVHHMKPMGSTPQKLSPYNNKIYGDE